MKKLIKSGTCYCFSLIEILISLLSIQTNVKIDENNVHSYLNPDCDSVFNYIVNIHFYFHQHIKHIKIILWMFMDINIIQKRIFLLIS